MAITLLTDFGDRDGFVGAMKGIILSRAPNVPVVDIAHDVPRGDIHHAAFVLSVVAPYFPPRTCHVVVVDPGVGTDRRPIGLMTGDQVYLAPDNGVLTPIIRRAKPPINVVHLTNPGFFVHPVSRTFHGRDIFAPVAANVGLRIPITSFGSVVPMDSLVMLDWPDATRDGGGLSGAILHIDRFGNAISNLPQEDVAALNLTSGGRVTAGEQDFGPVRETYASVAEGQPVALIGSSRLLEVAVRGGSAAEQFGLRVGSPVRLQP